MTKTILMCRAGRLFICRDVRRLGTGSSEGPSTPESCRSRPNHSQPLSPSQTPENPLGRPASAQLPSPRPRAGLHAHRHGRSSVERCYRFTAPLASHLNGSKPCPHTTNVPYYVLGLYVCSSWKVVMTCPQRETRLGPMAVRIDDRLANKSTFLRIASHRAPNSNDSRILHEPSTAEATRRRTRTDRAANGAKSTRKAAVR